MRSEVQRWAFILWIAAIAAYAGAHAWNLTADFPNHSPWSTDWAKYTDEGWYGNAAIRARLFGHWYLRGDFNPAVALPLWPALEWITFGFAGVSLQSARSLAIAFFFANLALTYLLVRARGPRWSGLLAVSLLVSSPFLYAFSRLAILEPLLTTLTLAALNLAVRLPRIRRRIVVSVLVGLIFALMMLTKTTAVFLLPALGWAILASLWNERRSALICASTASVASAITYGLWLLLVFSRGLMPDFRYLFFINTYPKPPSPLWPAESFWWSFHGGLWVDHILIPLAGLFVLAAAVSWRQSWTREFCADPVAGASVLAVGGYVLFMTMQDHPQPRYFAVVAVFCFVLVARGAAALCAQKGRTHIVGIGAIALAALAAGINAVWTATYVTHPQFTFIRAAQALTRYVDQHPNGNRLMVSVSGDEITLATHLPSLCDDFGMLPLHDKVAVYWPGWFATWNDLDPGTLADLHTHYSVEQVATFHAFDDPERTALVLFKLHPLPHGQVRDQHDQNLQVQLSDDKFDIDIE